MAVSRWRSTLTAVSCRPSLTRYMVMFAFPLRNPSAAEMFLGDIEDAVGSLERFPYAHMVRPGSNAAGRCEGCQSSTAKSAVHSISSKMESKTVRVVRVAKHRRHIISPSVADQIIWLPAPPRVPLPASSLGLPYQQCIISTCARYL